MDWNQVLHWFDRPESPILRLARSILISLIVLFIGVKFIKLTLKLIEKSFQKANLEAGVAKFLLSLSRISLYVVLIVVIMQILGFQTSSLVALVASAGLTIGLALQGSLSNFAGGVLILILKPFRVGDYIVALGNEGTVTGIDVFYTRLLTGDNKVVVIPNGVLSNSSIVNETNEPIRRLDLSITIDYKEDVGKVKELINQILGKNETICKEREANVFIENITSKTIIMGIRVWVPGGEYWGLKCNLLEELKEEFDENGIAVI